MFFGTINSRRRLCDRHTDNEDGCMGPHGYTERKGNNSSAIITTSYVVLRMPFRRAIKSRRVEMDLKLRSEHICPHLDSADEAVILALCSKKKMRRADSGIFAHSREAVNVTGHCKYCAARYTLLRRGGGGSLISNVRQAICGVQGGEKKCKDALLHVEDCGELHCQNCGTWRCSQYPPLPRYCDM
jgi:hypothetical protein